MDICQFYIYGRYLSAVGPKHVIGQKMNLWLVFKKKFVGVLSNSDIGAGMIGLKLCPVGVKMHSQTEYLPEHQKSISMR